MTDDSFSLPDYTQPDVASAFDQVSLWGARFGVLLLDNLPITRGQTILDLGSGAGFPLFELAAIFGPSSRVYGLDVWDAGIERARFKRDIYQTPNVLLVKYDGARFPFPDAAFDLITANLILNNLEDPAAVLGECARVAKRGVRFCATSNLVGHMQEFYDIFEAVLTEHGSADDLKRLAVNHAHRGTAQSHAAALESAGFRVEKVIEGSVQFRYADGSAFLRHWFNRAGFMGGWLSVIEAADHAAIFSEVERRLNAQARERGELRMTIPMLYVQAVRA